MSSCTWWPDHGTGGAAERYPSDQRAVRAFEVMLADLERRGAEQVAPAALEETRLTLIRVKREAAGGLGYDAEEDMAELWFRIQSLEDKLNRAHSLNKGATSGP
ncbi:hypothetical protein [Flexibacterium corallicola]|uniref:hypothetical protein n=1 Tax=Flexibacterium corallicola TaxID=3037259 RepID=UPI00286FA4A9|nr:hypothetical protein [Pseudovibrio sp. M1P-2-3]